MTTIACNESIVYYMCTDMSKLLAIYLTPLTK